LYGTSLGAVRDVASKGQICVMDIDIQVCEVVNLNTHGCACARACQCHL
jgi:guanylate kinase